MRKNILVFSIAITLIFTGCSGKLTTPKPTEKVPTISEYFPYKENVHTKYVGAGNEFAEYETYVDYIDNNVMQLRTINPGTTAIAVYVIEDDALKKVYSVGEAYYRLNFMSNRDTEEVLIKEPIAVGNSWLLADGSNRSITAINKEIEVPYGTVKALEVTTTGKDFTTKSYYAEKLGLVKTEFASNTDSSSKITSSLEKYEENVPYEQNIRIFLPDFNNDKLVYIERPIKFYTGTNLVDLFEEQMKQIPQNSDIMPITAQSVINSISYDTNTAIATVDISSKFISQMNAGSSLESMLLSCVTNTIGYYFQTKTVSITMDGGPYSSGHFYFEKGDYQTADWEGIEAYQQ